MSRESEFDPYSSSSPDASWYPDAIGVDGIRVSLRVEPAVDRLRRWRRSMSTPKPLTAPGVTAFEYGPLPGLMQRYVMRGKWVVDVEADSGERCRVSASSREEALTFAGRIHDGVQEQGVKFLRTFAS